MRGCVYIYLLRNIFICMYIRRCVNNIAPFPHSFSAKRLETMMLNPHIDLPGAFWLPASVTAYSSSSSSLSGQPAVSQCADTVSFLLDIHKYAAFACVYAYTIGFL